jgi:hypothetical protein
MENNINEVVQDQVVEPIVVENVQPDGVDVVAPSDEETLNPSVESDLAPEVKEHAENSKLGFEAREAKRELAKSQERVKELESGQTERDSYYAEQAAQVGRTDIKTESEYRKAISDQKKIDTVAKIYEDGGGITPAQAQARAKAEFEMRNFSQPTVDIQTEVKAILQAERRNASEISELNTAYSLNLNSIEDLSTEPNYSEILENLSLGMSYKKAYTVANLDTITNGNQSKAKQQAINEVRGQSHVQKNSTAGSIDKIHITQDQRDRARKIFPKDSVEQQTKYIREALQRGDEI